MKTIKFFHEDRLKILDEGFGYLDVYENNTEDEEHVVYKVGTKELHPEKTKALQRLGELNKERKELIELLNK